MAKSKAPTMDYDAHNRGYENFINMVKWSVIASVVVLALMAIFLL